jgi:hypothetical protein
VLLVAAALLVAISIGFLALWALWPRAPERSPSSLLLLFFLSCGFAFGILSVTFFCLRVINGQKHVILLDLILGAVIAGALFLRRNPRLEKTKAPIMPTSRRTWETAILLIPSVAFSLTLAASAYLFVVLSVVEPDGGWDAWAIWNARARFLFRAGEHWRDAFSDVLIWSHVSYPLLLPSANAHLWSYLRHDDVRGPIALAFTFTLATIGLAVSSLFRLRTRSQGFLAGLVLSSTKLFVERGASQYADVPLSFFYLATVVLLFLYDSESKSRYLALAGATAGFAAWTKDEGVVFFLCILAAQLAVMSYRRETRILRMLFIFVLGAAPVLAVLVWFKMRLGGPADLFRAGPATLQQLTMASRYITIVQGFCAQVLTLGGWAFRLRNGLILYLVLMGLKIDDPKIRKSVLTACAALLLTLLGYFFTYVIGPYDIKWWLDSSLDRLLIQLWPSVVFIFFIVAKAPEELLQSHHSSAATLPAAGSHKWGVPDSLSYRSE